MIKVFYLFVVLVCLIVTFAFTKESVDRELSLVSERTCSSMLERVRAGFLVVSMWLVSMVMLDL